MIRAVLLDLDDTLISTHTDQFFPEYLASLGQYGSAIAQPAVFSQTVLSTYLEVLADDDPTHTLYERYFPRLASGLACEMSELARLFQAYYRDCYPELHTWITSRVETRRLLDSLFERGYSVVVATNPGFPESATTQRMTWGGIPAASYPFALITTLESMHFGKPSPEYFEEIRLRLRLNPGEAIVVGDDWELDIVGAARSGLCTYWITDHGGFPPDSKVPISGFGTYEEFVNLAQHGWLESLTPPVENRETFIHRLRALPAALDTLRRTYRSEILECAPGPNEWSARDILCHLRDHEAEEDRARLERIVQENNPFISANYNPWAHAHEYAATSAEDAFVAFTRLRQQTVDWLVGLPSPVWVRPARYAIFGPTNFEEMVRFTTEHDLTHLHQIMRAIDHATLTCGP